MYNKLDLSGKEQMMKRISKWLIYDAVAVLLTAAVAYLLGARLHIGIVSLVPLFVTVTTFLQAIGARKYENLESSLLSTKFSKRDGQRSFRLRPPSAFDTKWDRIEEFYFLAALPYAIPFIFLGDTALKMTVSGILFCSRLGFPLITLPIFVKEKVDLKNEAKQNEQLRLRELEEQKKREELGEWK